MLFDTHTHLQFKVFDDIRDEVILNSSKAGVEKIIAVGTDLESSKKAVEISQKYSEVFASVGIHPHHVFGIMNQESGIIEELEKLTNSPKVVAIGETGMDKHIYKKTKYDNYEISERFINLQKKIFEKQIQLAIKHNKSLIIHNIIAVEETLEVLNRNWEKKLEGRSVFHFCEANKKILDFALKHRVYIGVDADVLTDLEKQEFVKNIPLEKLVLETDSPFMLPPNKEFPNTPESLNLISKKLAVILRINHIKLEEIIWKNSNQLFFL